MKAQKQTEPASASDPAVGLQQMISANQLVELSGISARHLRRLAAEGWFPCPIGRGADYPLTATIGGLLRYYREAQLRQKAGLVVTQEKIKGEDLRRKKLANEELEGELIRIELARKVLARCANAARNRMLAVGSAVAPKLVGLTPHEMALKIDEAVNAGMELFKVDILGK